MKEVPKPEKKSFDVQCSKCGAFFKVTEDLLLEGDVPVDDELVKVTLFLCPICRDMNIVKVDCDSLRKMRKQSTGMLGYSRSTVTTSKLMQLRGLWINSTRRRKL